MKLIPMKFKRLIGKYIESILVEDNFYQINKLQFNDIFIEKYRLLHYT